MKQATTEGMPLYDTQYGVAFYYIHERDGADMAQYPDRFRLATVDEQETIKPFPTCLSSL